MPIYRPIIFVMDDVPYASMSLNDDSYKRQTRRTAGVCAPLYEGNSCVSAATFGLGSWSVAFIHWEVYKARAINIQLCSKAQLTEGTRTRWQIFVP